MAITRFNGVPDDGAHGAEPMIAFSRGETLEDVKRAFVDFVIERTGGNLSASARWLGISRRSVQRLRTPKAPQPKDIL